MAQVYPPPKNKIQNIKQSNPNYWAILLSRSQYTENEIDEALGAVDEVNSKLQTFLEQAYDLVEGMGIIEGWDSDNHRKLNEMLSVTNYLSISFSQNSHRNALPIKTWQKEASKLNHRINKIEKFIEKNF